MNRSRYSSQAYYNRDLRLHKPGLIPKSSRCVSSITSDRHKYQLKQELTTNKTVEAWFESHTPEERRTVFGFLDTLHKSNNAYPDKVVNSRLYNRVSTSPAHSSRRQPFQSARRDDKTSKRDVGQLVERLESFRLSASVTDRAAQTSPKNDSTNKLDVEKEKKEEVELETNNPRPSTSHANLVYNTQPDNNANEQSNANNKTSIRYLSRSWRVINPEQDFQLNPRTDNNVSSFFNYTKKTYPEYFFIHPDWY